jgi:hypothetical protein
MNTDKYREKYKKIPYGDGSLERYPPGGADVQELCRIIEKLTQIIRHAQRSLPIEEQNEVERSLWLMLPVIKD